MKRPIPIAPDDLMGLRVSQLLMTAAGAVSNIRTNLDACEHACDAGDIDEASAYCHGADEWHAAANAAAAAIRLRAGAVLAELRRVGALDATDTDSEALAAITDCPLAAAVHYRWAVRA